MEFVVFIEGNVSHPLTIDPTVWIFDERKINLDTYFLENNDFEDEETKYKKKISAQWDKEIMEGSEPPNPADMNKPIYKKEELLTGTFGMPFEPFLTNSQPNKEATELTIMTSDNESHTLTLEKGKQIILGFSYKGKPLQEDGPVHVYFQDGSNQANPIKNVQKFIIK